MAYFSYKRTLEYMDKYGVGWFRFNEDFGNVIDSKGSSIGTVTGATSVTGFNGNALSFDGIDDKVLFNSKVIPTGKKTIKFRIKVNGNPSNNIQYILSDVQNNAYHGNNIYMTVGGTIGWASFKGVSGSPRFSLNTTKVITDNNWHDVALCWDGTTNTNSVKIYIDDMSTPNVTGTANLTETTTQQFNMLLGATYTSSTAFSNYFKGEIDELEVYNDVIDLITPYEKIFLKSNNKVYSLKSNEILHETKMTSNNAPSPFVASASGFYSTSNESWRAFNGTNASGADCWMGTNGSKSGWIQLDFGSNKKVNTVTITSRNDSTGATQSPKDFNVLGSNDGVNYVKIGAFTNITSWGVNVANTFHLSDGDYRYYKIDVLSNVNNTIVSIGKIVFGYAENITTELSHASRQNLINYGSSTIKNFNTIHTNKRYILQDTVSENADGLLEQKTNKKPLSIKFE